MPRIRFRIQTIMIATLQVALGMGLVCSGRQMFHSYTRSVIVLLACILQVFAFLFSVSFINWLARRFSNNAFSETLKRDRSGEAKEV
jgi:hypothetical protein